MGFGVLSFIWPLRHACLVPREADAATLERLYLSKH